MAVKRITMQDIADACGLSRNTVSKAFNGRGTVPEGTRRLILQTARTLGYGRFPEGTAESAPQGSRNVALLSQHKLLSHNFGAFFISSFTDAICRAGYRMTLYEVSAAEIAAKKLPPHFDPADTAAVLCVELFDRSYLDMVCALGLPCVLVDGYAWAGKEIMTCDFVAMENYAAACALTRRMIAAGAKRLGFFGDKEHCSSFSERWIGYRAALSEAGLPFDEAICVLDDDASPYDDADWVLARLQTLPALPDGFVCANDFLAIQLITALRRLGVSVPEDVMVTGFDGSPAASVLEPKLTTAHFDSADIGRLSAAVLLDRIRHPEKPFRRFCEISTPVWGGTTR